MHEGISSKAAARGRGGVVKNSVTGGGNPPSSHRGTATQNKVNPGPVRGPQYNSPAKQGYAPKSVPARLRRVVFPNRTEN